MDYVVDLGRRHRKRQEVHGRLLDISKQLFEERGLSRTTVEDIAEAADVARQTFFNHFASKEALTVELAADGMYEIVHHVEALLESGVPALDVLRRTGHWLLDAAIESGELAVVVARELLHPDPTRAQRASQQVPTSQIVEAILLQAREEGTIRDDVSLRAVAYGISAVLRGLICEILSRDPFELRQDLDLCFEIVFNGITNRRS